MPEITIDPQKIMQVRILFDHLIWQIIHKAKPEKLVLSNWYAEDGVSDKIMELWELIK